MTSSEPANKLLDILTALASHNVKHLKSFTDPSLGKVVSINKPQDMQKHLLQVLFDHETKSFTGANNRDFFYNPNSNTVIILNKGKDQNNQLYGGTAFRPDKKGQYFEELYYFEAGRLGREPVLHQKNGIVALRPEIAKEFAKGYLQQQQNDPRLNKNNPGHLAPAGKVAAEPKNKLQNYDIKQPQNFTKEPAHRRARTR